MGSDNERRNPLPQYVWATISIWQQTIFCMHHPKNKIIAYIRLSLDQVRKTGTLAGREIAHRSMNSDRSYDPQLRERAVYYCAMSPLLVGSNAKR